MPPKALDAQIRLKNLPFPYSGNGDKNKPETTEPQDTVHGLTPHSGLDKLFSTMNKTPFALMFADRGLTLRHVNPAAPAIFKPLEHLLPTTAERLIGQPLDLFHSKHGVLRKIISDPRNLPCQTQIIIGPKTLDVQVRIAPSDDGHYLGVIAHWTEITEPQFI